MYTIIYNIDNKTETATGNDYNALMASIPAAASIISVFDNKNNLYSQTKDYESQFRRYGSQHGLYPQDLHMRFINAGVEYEIAGYNSANKKYKIILKTKHGFVKATPDFVTTCLHNRNLIRACTRI